MKLKVLIIESSEIIVDGLKEILQRPEIRVLEPETNVDEIESRIAASQPDVVIVNPNLCAHLPLLRGSHGAGVVALVYQYVKPSAIKGFDAIIDINDSRASIIRTVTSACRQTKQGETPDNNTGEGYDLTKREKDVLIEVARGLTNKEIAAKLNVSVFTITSHRKNIIRKTGIKSVAGLTVYALLNNLIEEV